MIEIKDKKKCCGCTACFNKCPVSCISMRQDEEGFYYPVVDINKCIFCGLCEEACPIVNPSDKYDIGKAFAVQHKDSETLYHSAAGGAYSALGEYILERNGVVYGAAYNEKMVVEHVRVFTKEQLPVFRSSKYVQSYQRDMFKSVEQDIKEGKLVCYSGTPCQIAGLRKYLGIDYDNLITVDLVCKGVGSPKVLKQYVDLMKKKYESDIVGMNFKRKTYGYHSSTMSVDFDNGKSYSMGGITDLMMRSFRANICLRPSCYECAFKGKDRVSDLTIFDCWNYKHLTGKKDNDKGHTSVLVHTNKGLEMLKQCDDKLTIDIIDRDKAIELDGVMVCNSVGIHPRRNNFMKDLESDGLEVAVFNNIPIKVIERLLDSSKWVLHKMRVLNFLKKFKR